MAKLVVEVDLDGAALTDDRGVVELERILADVAQRAFALGRQETGTARDYNGITVCRFRLDADLPAVPVRAYGCEDGDEVDLCARHAAHPLSCIEPLARGVDAGPEREGWCEACEAVEDARKRMSGDHGECWCWDGSACGECSAAQTLLDEDAATSTPREG